MVVQVTQTFSDQALAKHGQRFDYAASAYIGFAKPIEIVCRLHGPFWTTPKSHLNSASGGCSKCRDKLIGDASRTSPEQFEAKARKVHGDYYDYRLVNYVCQNVPVVIVCPEHGPFRMKPYRHVIGRGCKKCAFQRFGSVRKLLFWEFVDRVVAVHGSGAYQYELKDFVNLHSKIPIHCTRHGLFYQSAASHLKGRGCPRCVASSGERQIREALNILEVEFVEQARFDGCRDRRRLPFDFYVPSHRLLIEFDGRQHYDNSKLWGGVEKLEETRRHDAIKDRFAAENDYRLVRIPHWEYDNIDAILLEQLANTV